MSSHHAHDTHRTRDRAAAAEPYLLRRRDARPRPATGEQYVLKRGDAVARIGQVAAVLREYSVAGTHYTETWPDDAPPPLGCGIVLMPWPNRVRAGRWTWRGQHQQLDLTEPSRGNAIHGLLRDFPYRVAQATGAGITLTAEIYPRHGWPFTLDTAVTYELTDAGLRVTHQVANAGTDDAVFGCGAHPYLRIGDVPTDDLLVAVRARSRYVADHTMIPVGTRPLDGALSGLREGMSVAGQHLDTGFGDLAPADSGRFEHHITAPDGRTLTLWADPDFAYATVFTPDDFPNDTSRDERGTHRAIAIEPMTCPADALNSQEGLIHLPPGETWHASWGLKPGSVTP